MKEIVTAMLAEKVRHQLSLPRVQDKLTFAKSITFKITIEGTDGEPFEISQTLNWEGSK